MLSRFTLSRFKSIEQADFSPGLITVLIGENGTGKSSVGQALVLLKQSSRQAALRLTGEFLEMGVYTDVVHAGNATDPLSIGLRLDGVGSEPFKPGSLSLDYELEIRTGNLFRHSFRCSDADGELFRVSGVAGQDVQTQVRIQGRASIGSSFVIVIRTQSEIGRPVSIRLVEESSGNSEFQRQLQTSLTRIADSIVRFLTRVHLVQALRGFESPEYPLTAPPEDLTSSEALPSQSSQVMSLLVHNRNYEDRLNDLLRQVTGRAVRFRVRDARQVILDVPRPHGDINIFHEGFGTNQLVKLLLQVLAAERESLIIVEEPEVHLHPRAQVNLAAVLLQQARAYSKQLLLVTHSEHILIALLNAVAEGRLAPGELAVYYFTNNEEDRPIIERLEVQSDGSIAGGLRGFFEVEVDEMNRYMKALKSRSK